MKRLLLFFTILISVCAAAQVDKAIPQRPSPPRLVNDYTRSLTAEQVQALENKLVAYNDSTSTQIAIVVVDDLKGYEAVEYAVALGRTWGVGGKQFNNGVVILVSTGGGDGGRDAFIATGYGLEGAVPDITAKSIVENDLIPNLKEGNFYRAFDKATDSIIKAAAGEYKAPPHASGRKKGIGIGTIIFIVIMLLAMFGGGGRNKRGGMMSRRGWGDVGTGWIIGSMLGGMRGGGGGGWSGGGGGGGFGGFGGGGFGGGGAGGKW
jgi:uncharacterized protein